MKQELDKCVLVIDEAMPRGLAANTAAILGITWGRLRPELVGEDVPRAAVPTASSSKKWPAPGRGSCDTWAWPFWAPGIRWTG